MLRSFFWDALDKPSESSLRTVPIVGGVGTGKSVSAIRLGEMLRDEARRRGVDLDYVYVNPKIHGSSRIILYRYLAKQVAREIYSPSLGAEELLLELVGFLRSKTKYLFIIFDEVDYFVKHSKEPVIYDLTRLNEISPGRSCGFLGVVFTARGLEYQKALDPAELSTLGRFAIKFPQYSAEQIFDILRSRVEEAFTSGIVGPEVLEAISDITVLPPVNGDIRYALDLLLYSGNLAEYDGSDRVTLEHVRSVVGQLHPSITTEDIINLPNVERLVLLALVRALKKGKTPYVKLRDIRSALELVCEEHGLKSIEEVEENIQDLADRGMVDIKSLNSIGISGIPTKALDEFLDRLIERIKGGIVEP